LLVWKELENFDATRSLYIDIGANHPTAISNTYLFYRRGLRGITIEPDQDLIKLHRRYRPGDVALAIACGSEPSVQVFERRAIGALSSLATVKGQAPVRTGAAVTARFPVPVLPLDIVMEAFDYDYISVLSIDTEGHDEAVIAGAARILPDTLFLIIEAPTGKVSPVAKHLICGSSLAEVRQIGCNLIFRNTDTRFTRFRLGKRPR
jgi:FkbM family methyltransferase